MAKRTPNYVLILILLVVSTAITYAVRSMPVRALYGADFSKFPTTIGAWHGDDLQMTGEVKSALNADSILSRAYTDAEAYAPVGLLVVYRKYGRRDFAHRPEMCYPASGWEIKEQGYTTVPYAGKNVRARQVVAEKDGQREVILYWFASGDRTEANFVKQQLMMALDRLKTQRYGWGFVRINSAVVLSEEDTVEEIRRFLRSASGPLEKTLTGGAGSRSARAGGQ